MDIRENIFMKVHILLFILLIVIAFAFSTLKPHKISGTINGVVGNQIVNAVVIEKGEKDTVTSDHLGRYSIKLSSPNAIIVISSFAYATAEIKVNGRKKNNVILKPEQEKPWDSQHFLSH